MVRLNWQEWTLQSRLFQRGDEFAPSCFFVNKQVVGSFRLCKQALEDEQLNEMLDRLWENRQTGMRFDWQTLDFVESLVVSQLQRVVI